MKYTRITFLQALEDFPILNEYIPLVEFSYKAGKTTCYHEVSEKYKTEFREDYIENISTENRVSLLVEKLGLDK